MEIGPRVRERRRAQKLSQEQLAQRVGVTWSAIQRLEAGQVQDPHFSTLSGIASALSTTVADLIGEPALSGKVEPLAVGAPELDTMLMDAGAKTNNLGDPFLLQRLQESNDATVRRIRDEVREELEVLLPALSRQAEYLTPEAIGYTPFSKARSWAAQQVFALKLFFQAWDEPEPETEGDDLLDRLQKDSAEVFNVEVDNR